jgi:hypothetical protein
MSEENTAPAAEKPAPAAKSDTFEVTDEHGELLEVHKLDTGIRIRLGRNPAKVPTAKLRDLADWLQGVAPTKEETEKAEKAKAAEAEKAKAAEAKPAEATP